MEKTNSLRVRIIMVAILGLVMISLVTLGVRWLDEQQKNINDQVGNTIKVDKMLRRIELDYFRILSNKNTFYVMTEDMKVILSGIEDIYRSEYLMKTQKYVRDTDDIFNEMEKSITLLRNDLNTGSFHIEHIQNLTTANDDLKKLLVESIRSSNSFLGNLLTLSYIILTAFIIVVAYFVHLQITRPLSKITKAFRRQQIDGYDLHEIVDVKVKNEIGLLADEYNILVRKNHIIREVNERIYNQKDFDEIFDYIYDTLREFIPYDRIGVAVISEDGKYIEAVKAKSERGILLPSGFKVLLENSSLKNVIEHHEVRIINDLSVYLQEHRRSESTDLIMKEGMRASITLPLFYDDRAIGVIFFSSTNRHVYHHGHQEFLMNIASAISVTLEKSFMVEDILVNSIKGFARIVESKDTVTGNHLDRMNVYSEFIAQKLFEEGIYHQEIDERYIRDIRRFSVLHDIGKVAIPDQVLNKPGKLTDQEFRIMKSHSAFGAEILKDLTMSRNKEYFDMAIDIARHHHEKYDGSGYPDSLKGNDIPLCARIVAVADVFDALTSDRPYKKAFTFDEAMEYLIEQRDYHFEKLMIDTLMKYQVEFKKLVKTVWAREGVNID